MARGNSIIVSSQPRGRFLVGVVKTGETPAPGSVVQIALASGIDDNGLYTFELYNRDADGNNPAGPMIVLLENSDIGKTMTDLYAAGEVCKAYIPLPGDELNMVISNVSGTAPIAPGLMIVDDGTGELIITTGSPEQEPFLLLETITDNAADQLGHCIVC